MYCHRWKNTTFPPSPNTDLQSNGKLRSRHFSSDINIKYYLSDLILEYFSTILKNSQTLNSVSFPFKNSFYRMKF